MKADRKRRGKVKAIAGDPRQDAAVRPLARNSPISATMRGRSSSSTPRPVVLIGDNGAGKTNLLEAVSLLGPGQGLRGRPYGELCRKDGAGGFAVAAKVVSRQDEVEIGTGLARRHARGERRAAPCASPARSGARGALAEHVELVWLIPAMDGLFTGPASERRRFLDRLVLAVDPKMRTPLGRYDRAMRQRNRLFQLREGSRALFEGLEEQMAEAGTAIAAARLDAVGAARRPDRDDAGGARRRALPLGPDRAGRTARTGPVAAAGDRGGGRISPPARCGPRARPGGGRALEGPHLSDLIVIQVRKTRRPRSARRASRRRC